MRKTKLAFTLIELLVVIAVIGILSGLIVVSMNGVTDKATIAKAQVFSNSLRSSLMGSIVSEWKLDGNVIDSWNGINNGTLREYGYAGSCDATHCPLIKDSGECVYGNCYYFDGSNDYIEFSDMSSLEGIDKLTISAWVYSFPGSDYRTVISKGYHVSGSWEFRMSRSSEGNNLSFGVVTGSGRVSSTIASLKNYTWHHIVGSYDGVKIYAYCDGTLIDSDPQTGNIVNTANTVKIGQNGSNGEFWYGRIDDVRTYDMSLPVSEIKNQYYSGLNRLFINGNMVKEEYAKRIMSVALY